MLLLLNMSAQKGGEPADLAFIQFMKCTDPLAEGNKALGYRCVRWNTGDGVKNTFETQVDSKRVKWLGAGKWPGVQLFESIKETLNVV